MHYALCIMLIYVLDVGRVSDLDFLGTPKSIRYVSKMELNYLFEI